MLCENTVQNKCLLKHIIKYCTTESHQLFITVLSFTEVIPLKGIVSQDFYTSDFLAQFGMVEIVVNGKTF